MKGEQKQRDSEPLSNEATKEQNNAYIKFKRILEIFVLVGFVFLVPTIIFVSIKGSELRSIEYETKYQYLDKMEAHCDGYTFSECQVVKVLNQTIELEPLTVKLTIADDLQSSVYEPVTLTNLEDLPKEPLDYQYVKLLFKEGYVSNIEVIGNEIKIREEQKKAVDAHSTNNSGLNILKSIFE